MLEIADLSVRYGTTEALMGLTLSIHQNDTVAVLGPNGAGKSSALRAISQLVPHGGVVAFDGVALEGRTPYQVARMGLIHVPEGRHVFPDLSVHENLQMGRVAVGARSGRYGLDDVYDLFPLLQPLRRRLGYALSGGEQQMVAIGRALISAPRVLMLDEPSLGLAPMISKVVFDALGQISGETPVLLVEQNTVSALEVCTSALVLTQGIVRMQGSASEMNDREDLLNSYLGRSDAMP